MVWKLILNGLGGVGMLKERIQILTQQINFTILIKQNETEKTTLYSWVPT
jgi:hypothetical protein